MNILNKSLLLSSMALSSVFVNAELISFGNLTTDTDFNVIADTELGREYLRFDEFNLTYAQTISATSVGGIYEGWSIADASISDEFINALLSQDPLNECGSITEQGWNICGSISEWSDNDFGVTYEANKDHYAYISDSYLPVGLVAIHANGRIVDNYGWGRNTTLDYYGGVDLNRHINLLLYRENTLQLGSFNTDAAANNIVSSSVPLPASLALLGIGMVGFSARRKSVKIK